MLTQKQKEFWLGFIVGLIVTGVIGAVLLTIFFL